ncbi:MAG: KpsF/GutQ family sugar-phosphate isomerase [Chlamydiales bacterium]|nr:KpsF/GutQ family sugar-phosphate isomerase [Chlamydiales bacterium]
MLASLFGSQRQYINAFFDELDLEETDKILQSLLACKGALVFTGVGKSGHIAQKIAATLVSTGTKAYFLSPAGALHGDIGCLSCQDVLIALSKSGSSKELLDLLPYVRKKGTKTIAVVSRAHSELAGLCDESIILPVVQELCPYNLVPTTSAAVQLIFGDCLAIALMKAKEFGLDELALNHPAGLLGRKITLKVADVMLTGERIPLCFTDDLLIDMLHELSSKRCGCLIVVDRKREIQGIFTDGDLRRALEQKKQQVLELQIGQLMTPRPKTIAPNVFIGEAMKRMEADVNCLITVLPVVEGSQVVGLLRMHDILQVQLGSS